MARSESTKRSRDAEQTKLRIVEAAKMVFAQRGYAQAGLREIATMAEITPALVLRYFGSKENLFAVALDSAEDLSELLSGTPETFGRDMVAYINSYQISDGNPLSIQLLAISDPGARQLVIEVLREKVLVALTQWLDRPEAETRAALITAVLSGVWIYRDLLPLPVLTGQLSPRVANWLAATLQQLATGPLETRK